MFATFIYEKAGERLFRQRFTARTKTKSSAKRWSGAMKIRETFVGYKNLTQASRG
jgi:hypothetical protein